MTRHILSAACVLLLAHSANAQREINKTTNDPAVFTMVRVQGGTFSMGSKHMDKDAKPVHSVTVKDFNLSAYEVTRVQWEKIMGAPAPSAYCNSGDCPVTGVSWDEAQAYLAKLNGNTGHHYRLPTEAEWEYAARGGDDERFAKYSGKRLPQTAAWYIANSKGKPHRIGRKRPNELGIYDMSGNAEEWCADWYSPVYYTASTASDPLGPLSGKSRVARGGSWYSDANAIMVTYRTGYLPGTHSNTVGFRVAED